MSKAQPFRAPSNAPDVATPATLPRSIINALPSVTQVLTHAKAIGALTPAVKRDLEKAKRGGHAELARAFVAFHRLSERLKEELKPMSLLFEQYKISDVPLAIEQAGVTNVPLDEGFRVGISYRWTASIKEGKKDQAYNWLTANKLGDIITPVVNAQTLAASAKSMMEEHNKELPSEFFTVAQVPGATVTKIAGK